MFIKIVENIKRFLFLILLQVLVLNHVQWSGYVNPYVYILFIMMLPVETPRWLVILLGLITGLLIDYESETSLTPQKMGLKWFITYATLMILIHHFTFFYIEVFRFSEFFITFFKALLNSAITLLIILLGMYLFGKKKSNERLFG
jgi:cell shape-determining protein MreD